MEVIIALIIIIGFIAYSSIVGGYVVYKFWYWFVLPVFPELPEVTYAQAIGLMFFIGLFKYGGKSNENDNEMQNVLLMIISPIITLLVGALVHNFIY